MAPGTIDDGHAALAEAGDGAADIVDLADHEVDVVELRPRRCG